MSVSINKSQKAVVIGATSGIGWALSRILVKSGYEVGITGRREENLQNFKSIYPQNVSLSASDCTESDRIQKLDDLVRRMGGMDALFFCAGNGELNQDLDSKIENFTNQLNVIAFTEIINWAYLFFQKQGYGHILSISSIGGLRGSGIAPAYNASKAYQINYLEGLRQKVAKSKLPIQITDVRPGFVDTDMAKGENMFWVATPEKAALQIFNLFKAKKDVGYVTKRWRVVSVILKLMPGKLYKNL